MSTVYEYGISLFLLLLCFPDVLVEINAKSRYVITFTQHIKCLLKSHRKEDSSSILNTLMATIIVTTDEKKKN